MNFEQLLQVGQHGAPWFHLTEFFSLPSLGPVYEDPGSAPEKQLYYRHFLSTANLVHDPSITCTHTRTHAIGARMYTGRGRPHA